MRVFSCLWLGQCSIAASMRSIVCLSGGGVSMRIMITRLACWFAPAVLAWHSAAIAQDKNDRAARYPNRPIRIIVAVAPGAGGDTIARIAGQMLADRLGQNAVIDNRSGGGGVIATELVARSAPDGHTLLSQGETVLLQGVTKRVPFDVLTAFDPVVATSAQPYILLTGPTLPVKSM